MIWKLLQTLRLFPAWAGVILLQPHQGNDQSPIPRMGGGDPSLDVGIRLASSYSPHGRG